MNEPSALERRNHIFAVIAGTVLALGLVRAVLVVAHSPALGYVEPGQAGGSLAHAALLLAVVAAIAIFTAYSLRRHPVASIVHALLFFLIVADPVATLWLASRMPERYALIGAYAVVAMVAVIAAGRAGTAHWVVLIYGLFQLAAGPWALRWLPLVLAVVGAPILARGSRKHAAIAIVAGLAAWMVGTLDPQRGAMVSRASLVPAMDWSESEHPLRALSHTLPAVSTLAPASLEVSSQGGARRMADLPPQVMSFAGLVSAVPAPVSMMVAMIFIATLPFAVAWLAWVARRPADESTAVPAAYTVLVAIAAYCAIATSYATGATDIARSQWLGALALLAAIAMLPLVAWQLSRDFWAGRIAIAVMFGILLLAGGWFAWARTEPIAIGAIERIAPGANRTLEVSGWAIDPRGMKRVYATVGGGPVTEAALGTERRDVQAAYPGYPDALTGGFQMSIASNAWRPGQALRIFAENRTGAITEIDRRDVPPAP